MISASVMRFRNVVTYGKGPTVAGPNFGGGHRDPSLYRKIIVGQKLVAVSSHIWDKTILGQKYPGGPGAKPPGLA